MFSTEPHGSFAIVDPEGILPAAEREGVEALLAEACRGAAVDLIVHLVDAVSGREFRAHAMEARRRYSRDPARSIILVISRCDRHAEIATAPQFSGKFMPEASAALLTKTLVPLMRQGRLADAIVASGRAICARVTQASAAMPAQPHRRVKAYLFVGSLLLIAGLVAFFAVRSHLCRECGHWAHVERRVITNATASSNGVAEVRVNCKHCGASYTVTQPISWSDPSSSSLDSGSSGGSSDGGGGADW